MNPRVLSPEISVSEQILPEELQKIADLGYKSVICNRPDGEGNDQPDFELIAEAAAAVGLKAIYIPVSPSGVLPSDIVSFKHQFDELPKPVFAYCRSGARSSTLFNLAQNA